MSVAQQRLLSDPTSVTPWGVELLDRDRHIELREHVDEGAHGRS